MARIRGTNIDMNDDDVDSNNKYSKSASGYNVKALIFLVLLLVVCFVVFDDVKLRKQSQSSQEGLVQEAGEAMAANQQKSVVEITKMQTSLQKEKEEIIADLAKTSRALAKCEKDLELTKQTAEEQKQSKKPVDTVQKGLVAMEQKFLRLRYGDVSCVKFEMNTDAGKMVFETAPFELMPHVVSFWLQQVESGYWDGCAFVRNADHVLQANCGDRKPSHQSDVRIAFQEYSEKYPHVPMTLGLAGFPAGTDFYINLIDNVAGHGPGGQGDPSGDANPCYAKMLTGEEVVKKIQGLPRQDDSFQGLKKNVRIYSMKVLR